MMNKQEQTGEEKHLPVSQTLGARAFWLEVSLTSTTPCRLLPVLDELLVLLGGSACSAGGDTGGSFHSPTDRRAKGENTEKLHHHHHRQ